MNFCLLSHADARQVAARMVGIEKWDWSGLYGVEDVLGGGAMYAALDDDGKPTMAIVIDHAQHELGRELVIRAAFQLVRGRDLVAEVLPEIERVFGAGCDAVTLTTKRAGLVRKLKCAGYGEAATIMRKKL